MNPCKETYGIVLFPSITRGLTCKLPNASFISNPIEQFTYSNVNKARRSKIGEVICDKNVLHDADVVLVPANDGFLWDLAWDHDFECHNSDMFKTFASLFVDKDATLDPLGCFISRQDRTIRTVLNLNETIGMMREIFPRVRVIHLTTDHTTDDTVDMLYECRVLFGIHGAGHMNACNFCETGGRGC